MRRWLALGLVGLCVYATLGGGAPVAPREAEKFTLPGRRARTFRVAFRAGERALVIASGNHLSPLALYVFDRHGNCVAWDDYADVREAGSDAALEFYPSAEEEYTVEVRNLGTTANTLQLIMR